MKVFLSHSTLDREFAERLAEAMRMEKIEPWLCEISIAPATNWVSEIEKGLSDTDIVLLLWSPNAANSAGTELEWTAALAREITEKRLRLGLILLTDCKLPEVLRTRQYIDARKNREQAVGAVLQWLHSRREVGRGESSRIPIYLPDIPSSNIIGRTTYLNRLHEAFTKTNMFLLRGEPGTGKSTLALMFASEAQQDFDVVVFQTCGQRTVEAITAELAEQLHEHIGDVAQLAPEKKQQLIKQWLKQRRSLVILDDIWLSTANLQNILPGPSVSVLFTSRNPNLPWLRFDQALPVESFTIDEAEGLFQSYLGPDVVAAHHTELLDFAEKLGRLPIAISVAADLLRRQSGPFKEALSNIVLTRLRNEIHDVPRLLQKAIESQSEPARRLLEAASVCAPEGIWLPLAIEIAGLNNTAGAEARDNLINASLMRVLDHERQRFQLHFLIREQARTMVVLLSDLQQVHSKVLEHLFKEWEIRWKECRECLQEIIPASEFLWNSGEISRTSWLTYLGFLCAHRVGELDIALRLLQQEKSFWEQGQDSQAREALLRNNVNQAFIFQVWGRLDEAFALHKKEEEISLVLNDKNGLQISYHNQALILRAWGRLDEAMTLLKKQEEICLELGNKQALPSSYHSQALILRAWGHLDEAMVLLKKQEEISLVMSDKNGLQISYGNQAFILTDWGRWDDAMALLKKQEEICLELGKHSLQISYGNQASILRAWEPIDRDREPIYEGIAFYKRRDKICLGLGDKDDLQIRYDNHANVVRGQERLEEALGLYKKREEICLELGNKSSLANCYWNWGLLARKQGDQETEKQKLEMALAIFTDLKMPKERDLVKAELEKSQRQAKGQAGTGN